MGKERKADEYVTETQGTDKVTLGSEVAFTQGVHLRWTFKNW